MITHVIPEFHQIQNAIAISTEPIPYGLWDRDKLHEYIKNNIDEDTKIFFDNAWEGHGESVINEIYNVVSECSLNPKNVYYVSGALSIKDIHDRYCMRMNITNRIHVYAINVWEHNSRYGSEVNNPKYIIKNKSKKFLCFNRIVREHRIILLGLLLEKNLVNDAYYSFFPKDMYSDEPLLNKVDRLRSRIEYDTFFKVKNSIIQHQNILPLKLNAEYHQNPNTIRQDDVRYFEDSYFSLVTETFYFTDNLGDDLIEHDSIFFSEKIFKPISMKHPFVLVHRPHGLKYLRRMGYKTFSPFINEDYDDIVNDEERMLAIVDEVERLCSFSDAEWIEFLQNVQEICEHNYYLYINKPSRQRLFYYE
jgi:hypothetical protein